MFSCDVILATALLYIFISLLFNAMKKIILLVVILLIIPACYANLKISVYLDDNLETGVKYTKLFRIDNLAHVTGVTDSIYVKVKYNVSGIKEDYFEITGLNKYKYAGTGEVFFEKAGNYTVCGEIIESSANDSNSSDDYACKNVTATGEDAIDEDIAEDDADKKEESASDEAEKKSSKIEITSMPYNAKFGETIDVELKISKGDSNKYAVYIEIKGVSSKNALYLKNKNTEYKLRIPVQIKPNCNNKSKEGLYFLSVYGLDAYEEEIINISGFNDEMCKVKIINDTIVKTEIIEKCPSNVFQLSKIKCNADLYKKTVYESASSKSYSLVPFMIIGVLLLLAILLIVKR